MSRASSKAGAIILCGGKSSRMGRDKALLEFHGQSFVNIACERALSSCEPVVLVTSANQKFGELPPAVHVICDAYDEEGPLAGFLTGLRWICKHSNRESVWLNACDTPLLPNLIIDRLSSYLDQHEAAVVGDELQKHPLVGVYKTAILFRLEELFAGGERSLQVLLRQLDTRVLNTDQLRVTKAAAFNINTPDDLKKAEGFTSSGMHK